MIWRITLLVHGARNEGNVSEAGDHPVFCTVYKPREAAGILQQQVIIKPWLALEEKESVRRMLKQAGGRIAWG